MVITKFGQEEMKKDRKDGNEQCVTLAVSLKILVQCQAERKVMKKSPFLNRFG